MSKKDRRKYPRIETDVTVEVYTSLLQTDEPDIAEICSVINMSETGMRFHATHHFNDQQLLRLTFLLPESIIIIRTDAKVIHLQRRGDATSEVGVQFTNIDMAERKLIRHFIGKKLNLKALPIL
jgi:c-di-GMP-binding flagellar brake protein YcgR